MVADTAQGQRSQPRSLPTTVESTVHRLQSDGPAASDTASQQGSVTRAAREQQSGAAAAAAEEEEERREVRLLGSPPQGVRSQGKPPRSPVRQSLQDLALSRGSSPGKSALVPLSIDPITGLPKHDVNVHCNPLFTEPLAGQQQSSARERMAEGTSEEDESDAEQPTRTVERAETRAEPASPPSELQSALRARLQRHAQEMQVCMTFQNS